MFQHYSRLPCGKENKSPNSDGFTRTCQRERKLYSKQTKRTRIKSIAKQLREVCIHAWSRDSAFLLGLTTTIPEYRHVYLRCNTGTSALLRPRGYLATSNSMKCTGMYHFLGLLCAHKAYLGGGIVHVHFLSVVHYREVSVIIADDRH